MNGDNKWITTLHYAFQDDNNLVRIIVLCFYIFIIFLLAKFSIIFCEALFKCKCYLENHCISQSISLIYDLFPWVI